MRPGTQVHFCFYRGDSQACITEQLCYGCRVNMKDLVSGCPSVLCAVSMVPWLLTLSSLTDLPGFIATLCPC